VGGDLVDLVSLADQDYEITYAVPKEVENDLNAKIVIQTAQKVRQVVYGRLEGSLNSLMAMSNNVVAKMWLDIDLSANAENSAQKQSTKFNAAS
jgi:hypothetical protein